MRSCRQREVVEVSSEVLQTEWWWWCGWYDDRLSLIVYLPVRIILPTSRYMYSTDQRMEIKLG